MTDAETGYHRILYCGKLDRRGSTRREAKHLLTELYGYQLPKNPYLALDIKTVALYLESERKRRKS